MFNEFAARIFMENTKGTKDELVTELTKLTEKVKDSKLTKQVINELFDSAQYVVKSTSKDKALAVELSHFLNKDEHYYRTPKITDKELFIELLALASLYKQLHPETKINVVCTTIKSPSVISFNRKGQLSLPRTIKDVFERGNEIPTWVKDAFEKIDLLNSLISDRIL